MERMGSYMLLDTLRREVLRTTPLASNVKV